MTQTEWRKVERKVIDWANENRPDDVWYGTRFSYWTAAKASGVCSEAEYEHARAVYGNLWHYRGD